VFVRHLLSRQHFQLHQELETASGSKMLSLREFYRSPLVTTSPTFQATQRRFLASQMTDQVRGAKNLDGTRAQTGLIV
jgi:hypothetical protein